MAEADHVSSRLSDDLKGIVVILKKRDVENDVDGKNRIDFANHWHLQIRGWGLGWQIHN
jgi:hypothetical protein